MSSNLPRRLGHYSIRKEIGRGSTGVVFEAVDTRLDRRVALKTLTGSLASNPESIARIEREAKTLASLNHPNIATIHDLEVDGGNRFLVLELVEGQSLEQILTRGPLPLESTAAICQQIAEGLKAAHDRGIIHRDLKPANLRITPDGRVKILDFGLALWIPSRTEPVSPTASTQKLAPPLESGIHGTPLYMSPEQVCRQNLDKRTDIWSFGCILFECLTGKFAFGKATLAETFNTILLGEPDWELLPEQVPAQFKILLRRCLEKNLNQRLFDLKAAQLDLSKTLAAGAEPHAAEGAPALRHNLPIEISSFIGRKQEIRDVQELLKGNRLVTLTGTGGCGKTRLALQVGARLLEKFAHGVWVAGLDFCSDASLLPQSLAAIFGLTEKSSHAVTQRLIDYLENKNLLLILDNCEHLLTACSEMADALLKACSGLRILATSREGLGIRGEVVYTVSSLKFPSSTRPTPLEELQDLDAIKLFIERARAVLPDFQLSKENAPFVTQICQRLDGIPLALELAAARMRVLSAEQIAGRLNDSFRLLTGGGRTALPRHQTLRAAIDWSYKLLSAEEQAMFRRLAVFSGGWSLEAAEAVCAGAPIGESEVLDRLAHLVDKSLVVVENDPRAPRYRLLDTVRQYARDRLLESGEIGGVRARHLQFFLGLGSQAEETFRTPGPSGSARRGWLERLELDHDNLRAALEWCQGDGGESEQGLQLAVALSDFWAWQGYHEEGRAWLEKALESAGGAAKPRVRARALCRAGLFASRLDDYESARAHLEKARAISEPEGDEENVAVVLQCLGLITEAQGDYTAAAQLLSGSLAIFTRLRDDRGKATSLQFLGGVAMNRGDYPAARRHLEESSSINRQLDDKHGIAASLNKLGNLALSQGDYLKARAALDESLALHRELGFRHGIARALANLGQVAMALGDYPTSQALLDESLALDRDLGNRHGIADTLICLARLAKGRGDFVLSRSFLEDSLALCQQLGYQQGIADSWNNLGKIALAEGDNSQARWCLEKSLAIYRQLGHRSGIAFSMQYLGLAAQREADYPAVEKCLAECLPLHRELGHRHGIADSLVAFAFLASAQEQAGRAARLFGAAEQQREAIGAQLDFPKKAAHDLQVTSVRSRLGSQPFQAAWSEGRGLSVPQAIQLALQPSNG